MRRVVRAALASLLAVAGALAAASARAEGLRPEAGAAVARIPLAALAREVEAGPALVFANDDGSPSRLVFERRAAGAVACRADGVGTERPRAGQYTLAPGAELHCTARPGRHPFQVLRASGAGIERSSSRLVVR